MKGQPAKPLKPRPPVWQQDLTGVDALVERVNKLHQQALKMVGGRRGKGV